MISLQIYNDYFNWQIFFIVFFRKNFNLLKITIDRSYFEVRIGYLLNINLNILKIKSLIPAR
jgi:hypothetical protein